MSGIVSSGKIYLTMIQITKGHNVAYLKRLAKTIKKRNNITHHQSLDRVAVNIGFNNWKHFLHSEEERKKIPLAKSNIVIKPLSQTKTLDPYRNLLVAAVNELVVNKHIMLDPTIVYPERDNGHVFLSLFGEPSVIIWSDRGYDELYISVWWKYDHNKHPQANLEGNMRESFRCENPLAKKQHYKKFVGIVTSGWLERKSDKYLQGENNRGITKYYTRKGELQNLKGLPVQKPKDYKSSGRFHM